MNRPQKPAGLDTPGLQFRKRQGGWALYWICRADIAERGYSLKTRQLWQGGIEPDWNAIASACTLLQDEMLAWARGADGGQVKYDGTVRGLIRSYQHDEDSPYHELRWKSKESYGRHMTLIERTVGDRAVAAVKGRDFRRWFENWAVPAYESGPRRIPRAHAAMTMVRILFAFGHAILEDKECKRLKDILSELQFEDGKPRTEEITAEQAVAIRAHAHAMGFPSVALAQAIQFELLLRQKDVIGEYLPVNEPGMSDVIGHGMKWLHGLDWREISSDLILTHRLSKSLRGRRAVADKRAGKTKVFNLNLYPMVMEEIARVLEPARVGPLIVDPRTGLPFRSRSFTELWRKIATAAGVPKNVQNRDSRAGGITEGIEATDGDIESARQAAGHSDAQTTRIYHRGEHRQTAKVAVLRATKREKKETE